MICILHGYLLEGSGSNLWTRSITESLCRQGHDVHLMAQENHPERYDFITEARRYREDGEVETIYRRDPVHPGRCVLHKPDLGPMLPVYVWDRYEEFPRVVPMVDLSDDEVEAYVSRNERALLRIVRENGITAMHANHAVLMSVVAQRVSAATGVPFAVMPHGSALEFAVKRDERFLRLAEGAFTAASRVFVIGDEMRERVRDILGAVPGLEEKFSGLHLGVDTSQFELVPRSERRATLAKMPATLQRVKRGKRTAQSEAMRARLRGDMQPEEMRALFAAEDGAYEAKAPDADVEARLDAVDWESEPTLLFVGRLISSKGIQSVIAALPLILAARPDLRMLVVGHGPLREPLEALLWALEHGERALFELIVARGRALEGDPEGEGGGHELTKVARVLDQARRDVRATEGTRRLMTEIGTIDQTHELSVDDLVNAAFGQLPERVERVGHTGAFPQRICGEAALAEGRVAAADSVRPVASLISSCAPTLAPRPCTFCRSHSNSAATCGSRSGRVCGASQQMKTPSG